MRRALSLLILALGAVACRGRAAPPAPADAGPAEPPWPGLTLDLTPDPARGELDVAIRVAGERARGVASLDVARAWGDTHGSAAIGAVSATDARGEVPLRPPLDEGPDTVLALDRAPAGELTIRYKARANLDRSRFGLRLNTDRLSGVGHAFLLLPRVDAPIPARVRWHLEAMRPDASAASSLGIGREFEAIATSEELAHAAWIAGTIREERDDRAAGRRLAVLGPASFDARAALAWAGRAATATERFFGRVARDPRENEPFSFVLVAEPGLGRGHDGAYLTRSVGLWFDEARPLDAELGVVLGHELTHRWIGGSVRLVDAEGRDALWFSEGFTVHYARRVLLDAGLLSPADFLADMRRTLDEDTERAPGVVAVPDPARAPYLRGARYAARLDSALRRASQGARSLDDLLADLIARARDAKGERVPVATFRELVTTALGPAAGDELDRLVLRGEGPIELPDDAFGPCFHRAAREEPTRDLGFERDSLRGDPAIVRGLVKGSPAERAGLREGAIVVSWRERPTEVELRLAGRLGKRIRYDPRGKRRVTGWEARPCPRGER